MQRWVMWGRACERDCLSTNGVGAWLRLCLRCSMIRAGGNAGMSKRPGRNRAARGVGEVCEYGLELVGYWGSRRNADALYRVLGGRIARRQRLTLQHEQVGKSSARGRCCGGGPLNQLLRKCNVQVTLWAGAASSPGMVGRFRLAQFPGRCAVGKCYNCNAFRNLRRRHQQPGAARALMVH